MTETVKVTITQFKWAGKLGPFRIKTTCNECDLTTTILNGLMVNELKDKNVDLEIKPWLDNLFYCLLRGAWHAPIVMVNGKKFHQFSYRQPLFNKQKLLELVDSLGKEG
ncbi:MAG: hypothetical protein COW92_01025 [Candidatus Omnitrophica bacterium CG22_combo_CG10-13_8_21_14_all_43_16]|nr:MAG: hypothetical protein COW92_01025 [Candidatus Omnitrophica bacterium CG22_combo_CG10-13_8_21_14_all_43_16]